METGHSIQSSMFHSVERNINASQNHKGFLMPNINIDIEEVSIGKDESFMIYDNDMDHNDNEFININKNKNLLYTQKTKPIHFDSSNTLSSELKRKSNLSNLSINSNSNLELSQNDNLNLTSSYRKTSNNLTINTANSSFRKLSNSSRRSKSSSDQERMLVFNHRESNISCMSNNISYNLDFDHESTLKKHSYISENEAEENQK